MCLVLCITKKLLHLIEDFVVPLFLTWNVILINGGGKICCDMESKRENTEVLIRDPSLLPGEKLKFDNKLTTQQH